MGFLKQLSRLFRSRAAVRQLPQGSMTVDRDGHVVTSTVPSVYPKALLREIGRDVLILFREARAAQMPLEELLGALTSSGLRIPEKSREKPVFVEHAGEIFWLNLNGRGELWLNAKESKYSNGKDSDGDKHGRRPK